MIFILDFFIAVISPKSRSLFISKKSIYPPIMCRKVNKGFIVVEAWCVLLNTLSCIKCVSYAH